MSSQIFKNTENERGGLTHGWQMMRNSLDWIKMISHISHKIHNQLRCHEFHSNSHLLNHDLPGASNTLVYYTYKIYSFHTTEAFGFECERAILAARNTCPLSTWWLFAHSVPRLHKDSEVYIITLCTWSKFLGFLLANSKRFSEL